MAEQHLEVHLRIPQTPVEGKMSAKMKMTEEVVAEADWCRVMEEEERERERSSLLFLLSTHFVWFDSSL